MKRPVIFLFLVFLLNSTAFAEPSASKEMLSQISDQFFKAVQMKDFDTASELFHYPPTYSIQERDKDQIAIKSLLEYFNQSFGKILSFKTPDNDELYVAISIRGGDAPYWTNNPEAMRIIYEVLFSNEGQGYVIIELCRINNDYEIRSVHYGFAASRKDCQQRLQEIYEGMMEVLKALES